MELREKIQKLVYAADLRSLGIPENLSNQIPDFKISQEAIQKYSQSFLERCTIIAWDICFIAFIHKYSEGTIEEFQKKYVGTKEGFAAYKLALDEVTKILPTEITVEYLSKKSV